MKRIQDDKGKLRAEDNQNKLKFEVGGDNVQLPIKSKRSKSEQGKRGKNNSDDREKMNIAECLELIDDGRIGAVRPSSSENPQDIEIEYRESHSEKTDSEEELILSKELNGLGKEKNIAKRTEQKQRSEERKKGTKRDKVASAPSKDESKGAILKKTKGATSNDKGQKAKTGKRREKSDKDQQSIYSSSSDEDSESDEYTENSDRNTIVQPDEKDGESILKRKRYHKRKVKSSGRGKSTKVSHEDTESQESSDRDTSITDNVVERDKGAELKGENSRKRIIKEGKDNELTSNDSSSSDVDHEMLEDSDRNKREINCKKDKKHKMSKKTKSTKRKESDKNFSRSSSSSSDKDTESEEEYDNNKQKIDGEKDNKVEHIAKRKKSEKGERKKISEKLRRGPSSSGEDNESDEDEEKTEGKGDDDEKHMASSYRSKKRKGKGRGEEEKLSEVVKKEASIKKPKTLTDGNRHTIELPEIGTFSEGAFKVESSEEHKTDVQEKSIQSFAANQHGFEDDSENNDNDLARNIHDIIERVQREEIPEKLPEEQGKADTVVPNAVKEIIPNTSNETSPVSECPRLPPIENHAKNNALAADSCVHEGNDSMEYMLLMKIKMEGQLTLPPSSPGSESSSSSPKENVSENRLSSQPETKSPEVIIKESRTKSETGNHSEEEIGENCEKHAAESILTVNKQKQLVKENTSDACTIEGESVNDTQVQSNIQQESTSNAELVEAHMFNEQSQQECVHKVSKDDTNENSRESGTTVEDVNLDETVDIPASQSSKTPLRSTFKYALEQQVALLKTDDKYEMKDELCSEIDSGKRMMTMPLLTGDIQERTRSKNNGSNSNDNVAKHGEEFVVSEDIKNDKIVLIAKKDSDKDLVLGSPDKCLSPNENKTDLKGKSSSIEENFAADPESKIKFEMSSKESRRDGNSSSQFKSEYICMNDSIDDDVPLSVLKERNAVENVGLSASNKLKPIVSEEDGKSK